MVLVVNKSNYFDPIKSDAILVLGHAIDENGMPSLWLNNRLNIAIQLYFNNYAPYIIVTGGAGPRDKIPVAYVMRSYLIKMGIPPSSILTENISNNTYENFMYASIIARDYDISNIILVTNGFHMYRSILLGSTYFEKISPATSHTPFSISSLFAYIREPVSIVSNLIVYRVINARTYDRP